MSLSSLGGDEVMGSLASAGQEILLKVTESKPNPVILSPNYTSELILILFESVILKIETLS